MRFPTVSLGDIARIERNSIQPKNIIAGTNYVGLEHIESGGRSISYSAVNSGELSSSKFEFDRRHVLFGKLRPYLAKIVCPPFDGICSTDILPILPGPKVDQHYLAHFLRQQRIVDWAASRATGINLPRLSPSELASIEFSLPPLDEQRRIAAILEKADALRRKRQRAIDLLDGMTQSIFLEMFGTPGDATSQTEQRPLGDLAELINGDRSSNYPSGDDIVASGILFLNTANITSTGLDFTEANYITPSKCNCSRGWLQVI